MGRAKIHAAAMAESLPLHMMIGLGDGHDSMRFIEIMGKIRVRRGAGRPMGGPKELYGLRIRFKLDKGA
jgi:ribose 5-phosphate isomerase